MVLVKKALSNAFSVQFNGVVKSRSTFTASTTADYAEFFEWMDGNPNNEERVGYFVTLDGDRVRIANPNDEYILGVVSGEPFVLGNGDCDTWNEMFLHDEFRRTIYEPAPLFETFESDSSNKPLVRKQVFDKDGNPIFKGLRPMVNPDYDPGQPYLSRSERQEWSPIGMLGVLAVRHDGSLKKNGYATITDGGIATSCEINIIE